MVVPLFGRIVVWDYLDESDWATDYDDGATGTNAGFWLVDGGEERNGSCCSLVAIVRSCDMIGQNCRQHILARYFLRKLYVWFYSADDRKTRRPSKLHFFPCFARVGMIFRFFGKLPQPLHIELIPILTNILRNVTFKIPKFKIPAATAFIRDDLKKFPSISPTTHSKYGHLW